VKCSKCGKEIKENKKIIVWMGKLLDAYEKCWSRHIKEG